MRALGGSSAVALKIAPAAGLDQLPVSHSQCHLRSKSPVERLVRRGSHLRRIGEEGEEVDAVELPGRVDRHARGRQGGREDVELNHGPIIDAARGNVPLPLHQKGNANAPLPGLRFKTP